MPEPIVPAGALDWIRDHVRRYLATDGQDGHIFTPPNTSRPLPALLLTTVGRRSGQRLVLPLVYGRHGRDLVVVASRAGSPHHPSWYLNLVAHPQVEVQVLADRFAATARLATGEERDRLWRQMVEILPNYETYQAQAGRVIPVVILERGAD